MGEEFSQKLPDEVSFETAAPMACAGITIWRTAILLVSAYCVLFTLACMYMHTWVAGRVSAVSCGIDVEKWHIGLFGELVFDTPWRELPREIVLILDDYFQGRIVTT